jgi:hypothetical protein
MASLPGASDLVAVGGLQAAVLRVEAVGEAWPRSVESFRRRFVYYIRGDPYEKYSAASESWLCGPWLGRPAVCVSMWCMVMSCSHGAVA